MSGSGQPKCNIRVFKIYIVVREVVNLAIWMATMATIIPEIERNEFSHLMIRGAIGFGIFCAVIARCNRLLFSISAAMTDGSIQQNKKRQVKNHGGLKFFYFPLALMMAAVVEFKNLDKNLDSQILADLGSAFAFILGILIIVINVMVLAVFVIVYKNKVNLFKCSALILFILLVILLFTTFIGVALTLLVLGVIGASGTWQIEQVLLFILIILEIMEVIADLLVNWLCIQTKEGKKEAKAYM